MKRLTLLAAAAALALGAVPGAVLAQSVPGLSLVSSADQALTPAITVPKDKSAAFRLEYAASEMVVAQPDILQLVATTDRSFYVRGLKTGVTNLLVYDKAHRLAQVIDVRVGADLDTLRSDLAAALPNEQIRVANFGGGVMLSGNASTGTAARRAMAIAENYAPKAVQNGINVASNDQVQVEVRVIEASRTALKDLGFNLSASTGGFTLASGVGVLSNQAPQATLGLGGKIGGLTIDASINALETKGVIRTLAKPNLTAISGEEASFLAGGEFPYPIPGQNGQISIEFREFGVKLNFLPIVLDNGQIRLKIAPEVSALDARNRIRIAGFDLPSLTTRKASTTVELRDGQSFAMAGLFQQEYANQISQVPGASKVPVLGALFRSSSWKRNETELVIIVTPKLTSPANDVNTLPNPLANGDEPTAIDLILNGMAFKEPLKTPISTASVAGK
ncbi:MAG: type II and III secretion system protein family protein [Caulobacteraceae bacterium]